MKTALIHLTLIGLLALPAVAHAQRIAFVDTKYILEQMPDYAAAQQELDQQSTRWQKEIDDRWSQIKRMRDAYNAEAILLTDDMKRSRQEDIAAKENEARDLQKKRFGVGGDLFKKRQELVQPIQDRIYQAVKDVAGTTYVAVFDIGGMGNNVLYASEKFDKSDAVLRKLGIKPGKSGGNSGNVRGDEEDQDQEGDKTPPKDGGRDEGTKPEPPGGGGDEQTKPK
jgi:outer membrane protein